MARKTPIGMLNDAISGILSEYEGEISENIGTVAVEIGKKGVQALRRQSRETFPKGTGKYAKGWKSSVEEGRHSTKVTIYNDHPGRAHLLEHGHVTRNGTGRVYAPTPPHVHIAPVAEELVETFEREVHDKL